jgi:hypothetical protein
MLKVEGCRCVKVRGREVRLDEHEGEKEGRKVRLSVETRMLNFRLREEGYLCQGRWSE